MSVLVEQNPSRECEDDHETGINERCRTDVRPQVQPLNNQLDGKRKREAAQDADHPRWKVRAEDVDCRGMMTGEADRDPPKNDNSQTDGGKPQKCSTGSHFCKLLRRVNSIFGVTVAVGGLARSPTLNASAA